jgi:hypothetical protein
MTGAKALKLQSLADLKSVKKEIDRQAAERAAQEAARIALIKQQREEKEMFSIAVGRVSPLPHKDRSTLPKDQPPLSPCNNSLTSSACCARP